MARPKRYAGTGHKTSFYFPDAMLKELNQEARRQDRSRAWLVKEAWLIARDAIAKFPSAPHNAKKQSPDDGG
jgi:uncharacterized small protein (TIGR04563 family)